jgi:hypothetical protein
MIFVANLVARFVEFPRHLRRFPTKLPTKLPTKKRAMILKLVPFGRTGINIMTLFIRFLQFKIVIVEDLASPSAGAGY